MRTRWIVVCVALVLAGCSSDDDDDPPRSTTTTTEATTSTTAATTTTTSSTTTTFDGATAPVTIPLDTAQTMLLTGVTVEHDDGVDRVTFDFRGEGVPLVDAQYVDEVRADGSGEPVEVEGSAYLQIRMEPASTADLSGEEVERTYTGPDRVRGETTAVTEVVRTGDFEANLTWVIGVRTTAEFRISATRSPARVVVELAG